MTLSTYESCSPRSPLLISYFILMIYIHLIMKFNRGQTGNLSHSDCYFNPNAFAIVLFLLAFRPALVVGTPVHFANFRLADVMPNALFHENPNAIFNHSFCIIYSSYTLYLLSKILFTQSYKVFAPLFFFHRDSYQNESIVYR